MQTFGEEQLDELRNNPKKEFRIKFGGFLFMIFIIIFILSIIFC